MRPSYAFDSVHQLILISKVDKNLKEKYSCISCSGILIPKKGQTRKHHFAHKPDANCTFESYLHKLAKLEFQQEYLKCLHIGKPFYLENTVNRTCTGCIDAKPYNTICELGQSVQSFDLTIVYDEIQIEKMHNGYIADILLVSNKYNRYLFIEFAVTHVCDAKKIRSGNPIVEFNIKTEEDLAYIKKRNISNNDENITYYNIPAKEQERHFNQYSTCDKIFKSFIVYKSGKAVILRKTLANTNYLYNFKNYNWFYFIATFDEQKKYYIAENDNFKNLLTQALQKGVDVKNCFGCKFYSTKIVFKDNKMYDIFCKKHGTIVENSNAGADCKYFWRIEIPRK